MSSALSHTMGRSAVCKTSVKHMVACPSRLSYGEGVFCMAGISPRTDSTCFLQRPMRAYKGFCMDETIEVGRLDVNGDEFISPVDALQVINALNLAGAQGLPPGHPLDVSGDDFLSPVDALIIINYLNAHGSGPVTPPPQCRDGIDNDGNGAVDFPADLGCRFPNDNRELLETEVEMELETLMDRRVNIVFPQGFSPGSVLYAPLNGTLSDDAHQYVPNSGFTGTDAFVLIITNGNERLVARVMVNVSRPWAAIADALFATADTFHPALL